MKKRMVFVMVLAVLLTVLVFSGCSDKDAPVTPENPVPEPVVLPGEKEITVLQGGEEMLFTGTLAYSNKGYGIYLLPGFELQDSDWFDLVVPAEGSSYDPGLYMKIYEVDPMMPIPEAEGEYGVTPMAKYRRIALKAKAINVQMNYPWEVGEDGCELLREMAKTMCDVK
ncbi:MAG: hypothetical protein FWG40_09635 [Peptococcaceae bacterium]|nr:hypothetical protein [Peptococcaceae bacterium]